MAGHLLAPDAAQASPDGLETALKQCRKSARRGYRIAKENLRESATAIQKMSKSLSQCLKSLEGGSIRTPAIVEQVESQLRDVIDESRQLQLTMDSVMEERRQRLDRFSVTLFGRTLAGKSTLMEILTRGDGASIGTGAQRTTRDIRSYYWNGLEVTDVPGVAAFDGEADEELAFKAASQADLVLFLITDDAPQPVEAKCLAQVCRLGRPVVGICNVKVAIDDEDDLRLFLRDSDTPFDGARLEQLINQFHAFVDQYLPGMRVSFSVTHLRSRFLAGQPQFSDSQAQLTAASRFEGIESRIVREVLGRGAFPRVKTFIDGAVAPLNDLVDRLLKLSEQNSSGCLIVTDKREQFHRWAEGFEADGEERIDTLASKVAEMLRDELPAFVEDHYEDRAAGESWMKLVEATGVNREVENLQQDLVTECKKGLSEVARELKSELSLVGSLTSDLPLEMDSVFDTRRALNWGTTLLSGGLAIAAICVASGPVGWALGGAAAIVGIGGWLVSFFLKSREEKARRARERLTKLLRDHIHKMERDLRKRLKEWFHHELIGQQVEVLLDDFEAVKRLLSALAEEQRTLAWTLNDRQKALARILVEDGLERLQASALGDSMTDVARIAGLGVMILIAPGTTFPDQVLHSLKRLLGEEIWLLVRKKNRPSLLAQAMGQHCDSTRVRIDKNARVAHVPLDVGGGATARVRLAQQLMGLRVISSHEGD